MGNKSESVQDQNFASGNKDRTAFSPSPNHYFVASKLGSSNNTQSHGQSTRLTLANATAIPTSYNRVLHAMQMATKGRLLCSRANVHNLQTETQNSVQGFPATINQHLLWDRKAEG